MFSKEFDGHGCGLSFEKKQEKFFDVAGTEQAVWTLDEKVQLFIKSIKTLRKQKKIVRVVEVNTFNLGFRYTKR